MTTKATTPATTCPLCDYVRGKRPHAKDCPRRPGVTTLPSRPAPTYPVKLPDGSTVRVTVPTHDAGREMEMAIDALRAVAGWASDEGPLKGKGPMEVSAFARAILRALGEVA